MPQSLNGRSCVEDGPKIALGASWGPLGRLLEASWGLPWSSWGPFGGILGSLGTSWACLGGPLETIRFLNAIWKRLGGDLEATWGRLGAVLGPPWARLGASWGHLGASWSLLGPSWGLLGASWGHLGAISGVHSALMGPEMEAGGGQLAIPPRYDGVPTVSRRGLLRERC